MKQIYKYLPYNPMMLWGSDGDEYYEKGQTYELNDLVFNSLLIDYDGVVKLFTHNNVKPVLRPFENLTKSLPLTKAAAEMIGMKEGDIISVVEKFYDVLGLEIMCDGVYPYIYPISGVDYDSGTTKIRLNPNYTIWIDSINPHFEELLDFEKAFDFLRAMHFALDFKEGEYIKLED